MHEFFPIREWNPVEGQGSLGSINLELVGTASITKNEELPDSVRIWFLGGDHIFAEPSPELLEVLCICNDEGEGDSE